MGKNKESRVQRAKEQGYPVDTEAAGTLFNFFISPVSSAEVDAAVMIDFSKKADKMVKKRRFECELSGIIIFPMALNPVVPAAEDGMTWSKRDRVYKIRRKLDFVKWQEGSDETRKTS